MHKKIAAIAWRGGQRTTQRFRVSVGFLIIAVLIGIGVVPVRKGLTVRYRGTAPLARSSRKASRRSHRRGRGRLLARLFGRR
jgi:hypothetical protein